MIENCKVNFDGSNYLAQLPQPCPFKKGKPKKFLKTIEIPADNQATTTCETPQDDICDEVVKYAEKARAENDGKEKKKAQTKKIVVDLKEIFNKLFLANAGKTYNEKKNAIIDGLRPYFENDRKTVAFVDMQLERVRHNQGQRNARLWKKLNNVPFNYFITVTYDSKKHTEESFRKAFTNFLKHAVYRKNWRYIGVWERGNAMLGAHNLNVLIRKLTQMAVIRPLNMVGCKQNINPLGFVIVGHLVDLLSVLEHPKEEFLIERSIVYHTANFIALFHLMAIKALLGYDFLNAVRTLEHLLGLHVSASRGKHKLTGCRHFHLYAVKEENVLFEYSLMFHEVIGLKGASRDRKPHVWDDNGKAQWFGFTPTESEYEAIASKVEDYIAMYADQELIENHGMKMGGM